ncbi:DUF3108 domain-containing protein [Mucilaginibacter myungsuensis]|uniref:Polysaccharide lyase-like protein n=1 Tax=Mucilaginibacter myungsuensis TaxID=649104 RepID=A0A929PXL9_9SPHI|nr:hypothetical protein [Mucilaginibacter myungsuensis]MBE9663289.1 hypothetical protein [Mucilaginibacter myungsuensis]MDN3600024.1 hypothetical protein [Mucilaginibacter myungsuensis]
MHKHLRAALFFATVLWGTASYAQVDTIGFEKGRQLQTVNLKPGLKQYIVYFQQPKQKKALRLSLWVREVRKGTHNAQPVFITSQHWYGSDTLGYRTVYSINSAKDFSPVYHAENIGGKLKAFNWTKTNITGADTVANNTHRNFKLDLAKPVLNWNLDIETFEQLPLAAGKTFAINFYDAGLGEPKYVLYKVVGSEVISLLDNIKTDCWKLQTEGKAPDGSAYTQTFWISKKDHEFLKEEDAFGGMYRYKIKMPATSPDLLRRF